MKQFVLIPIEAYGDTRIARMHVDTALKIESACYYAEDSLRRGGHYATAEEFHKIACAIHTTLQTINYYDDLASGKRR